MKPLKTQNPFWLCMVFISLISLESLSYASGNQGHAHDHHQEPAEEHAKGPNGGKRLQDEDIEVELAIFEQGVPPEYRAWITHKGKPVDNAQLTVTLIRLGGQQDVFNFSHQGDYWLGDGVVNEPHSFDVEVTLNLDGKNYQWHWESHEGRVSISAEIAKKVGISTYIAGPGRIKRQLPVYGRLVMPPSQKVQVHARFPGVITAINVNTGETVRQGDLLAVIESNESLQSYQVRAPIEGVVQARGSNVGEITTDLPLLTLINTERLWAELKIFPSQRSHLAAGQKMRIQHRNDTHESEISHITPSLDGSPFTIARAELNNQHQQMAPGDFVNAEVLVETLDAPLVVHNRALQDFRNWRVVFIKVGNTYEIRPLELGLSDGEFTQVMQGLNVGDEYVVDNSYLIKADIEKSGATHDH